MNSCELSIKIPQLLFKLNQLIPMSVTLPHFLIVLSLLPRT